MQMAQGNGSRYLNTQTNGWITKTIMFFKGLPIMGFNYWFPITIHWAPKSAFPVAALLLVKAIF
jgi:hypothetical protein